MGEFDISVVVPCLNGAAFVRDSLAALLAYSEGEGSSLGRWEVILVDDGSTDGTGELVRDSLPAVRVLTQPRNLGKGAAVRRGMLEARGEYRFFIDADLPFDLRTIARMHHYLSVKEFDVVIGARTVADVERFARRTLLRRIGSALFTGLVSRLVVTGVRDTQCGLKGFRAEAARYLFGQARCNGFAFDVEILYLAFKNDLDVKRVPVALVRQDHSTVSVLKHGARMLVSVALLPVRYYSGRYVLWSRDSESAASAPGRTT